MASGIPSCSMWDLFTWNMYTLSWGMCDLVPWPGIKPMPPAPGAQSLSHWATREVPIFCRCFWWLVFSPTAHWQPGASMKLQGRYGTVGIVRKVFPHWFPICLLTSLPTEPGHGCWNFPEMNLVCPHVIRSSVCREPPRLLKATYSAPAGVPCPVAKGG